MAGAFSLNGYSFARCAELVRDWLDVTSIHEYQDSGRSFNENNNNTETIFQIRIEGIKQSDFLKFKMHFDDARFSETFSFTDKHSVTYTNCRYKKFALNYNAHKSWDYTLEAEIAIDASVIVPVNLDGSISGIDLIYTWDLNGNTTDSLVIEYTNATDISKPANWTTQAKSAGSTTHTFAGVVELGNTYFGRVKFANGVYSTMVKDSA